MSKQITNILLLRTDIEGHVKVTVIIHSVQRSWLILAHPNKYNVSIYHHIAVYVIPRCEVFHILFFTCVNTQTGRVESRSEEMYSICNIMW